MLQEQWKMLHRDENNILSLSCEKHVSQNINFSLDFNNVLMNLSHNPIRFYFTHKGTLLKLEYTKIGDIRFSLESDK